MKIGGDPFSGISIFLHAAEAGSFTVAARLLGLTPSAVSKAVTRLEAEMGVRLFHRSPRAVSLTSQGQALFDRCRPLMVEMTEARAEAGGAGETVRGRLRAAMPVSFAQYLLAPALPQFLAAHPGVSLELVMTDRAVDLAAERFDLAVRLGAVPESRLVEHRLPEHLFVTVASPEYLHRHGVPHQPEDLAGHRCLGYLMAATGQPRLWSFVGESRDCSHLPQGALVADSAAVLLELALAGEGLMQAPAYVVGREISAGRLVRVLTGWRCPGAPLSVIHPASRWHPLALRRFIGFVKKVAAEAMPPPPP